MRYILHIGAILVLGGMALMALLGGKWLEAIAFLAGAGILFIPIVRGGTANLGDADQVITFFRDPAGAIVDAAIDRAGDAIGDKSGNTDKPAVGGPQPFDADAAFERYMANRPARPPAVPAAPAPGGFGRKGL
jgi:hypothetical protein